MRNFLSPLRGLKCCWHPGSGGLRRRLNTFAPTGLICLLPIILFGAGCPRPVSIEGQAQLSIARQQYHQEKFSSAVQSLSVFLQREPSSIKAGEAYYLRGLCYRQMEPAKNDLAIEDFQQVIKRNENEPAWALAQAGLGHIYFENQSDHPDRAMEHYRQALRKLPNEPPRDVVLYRLGVCLQMLGSFSEADLYLSRCFDDFGDSIFARYARDRFGSQSWRLQFEAFSDLNRAQQLVARLKQRGLLADWSPRRVDNKLLYAVRSGRYNSYKQAEQAMIQVRDEHPHVKIVPAP
jgi:tetratricopeptide (TPR) repeat protein